jgi:preprotein translocase subunit SecY
MSPDDMAKQLKDHGSFIPGLRPGPRTAEYLQTVLGRITYVGAGFLAIIAVIPTLVTQAMGIPFQVSQFLGGTGLLIVVSVGLDLIQRLEANLVMRNYEGFLGQGGDARGSRMRSARG